MKEKLSDFLSESFLCKHWLADGKSTGLKSIKPADITQLAYATSLKLAQACVKFYGKSIF
jgi:hypothetical protein